MITQKPSPNFKAGRSGYKPEVIVLHIAQGSLNGTDTWFANSASQVSSHYIVGFNGEIHQYVKDEDTAWANGIVNNPSFKLYKPGVNPNLYTLSIENEGNDLNNATEDQLKALAGLISSLGAKWGINISRDTIIGHYQVDAIRKPNCPALDKSIIDKIVARIKAPTTPVKTMAEKKAELIRLINEL